MPKTCADCQHRTAPDIRQLMGCAYLPTVSHAAPWSPAHLDASEAPDMCPGYTTTLPMVREVVEAYPHWEHGTVRDLIGGTPGRALLEGLAALRAGIRERDAAELEARSNKGGV